MKWLLLAAAWLFYGLAFCLTAAHVQPSDTLDDYLIPRPIDQARTDDKLIREILKDLDCNIYLDDLEGKWDIPNSDSDYILKGLLP